jgi:hypothetical protein
MRVRIESHIRGELVQVLWDEGTVTGDLELVDRARRMYESHSQQIDESDVAAFIAALEQAAGGRVDITIWPDSERSDAERSDAERSDQN